MTYTAYEMRDKIRYLKVLDTNEEYEVGVNGVTEIQFSAGTSGHEYSVILDGYIIQFRGCKFRAEWSRNDIIRET